jgi:hypothetical protein
MARPWLARLVNKLPFGRQRSNSGDRLFPANGIVVGDFWLQHWRAANSPHRAAQDPAAPSPSFTSLHKSTCH